MTIKIISRKYAQFNEALKLRNDILLNSDSHLPKKKLSFASMIALQKW